MYKVVAYFNDLQDGGHEYNPGDEFPRDGINVSDDRLNELSGTSNRLGMTLIEKVEIKRRTKKTQ